VHFQEKEIKNKEMQLACEEKRNKKERKPGRGRNET
jgi:hypothetical protein